MYFCSKRQGVVVKTEGLGSSGLPGAVALGCGRSSGVLGRPAWQRSWPRRLAVWLSGATQEQLETQSVSHLHKEFLVYIDGISNWVPDAIGASTAFSLGLALCWKCAASRRELESAAVCWGWRETVESEAGLRKGQS